MMNSLGSLNQKVTLFGLTACAPNIGSDGPLFGKILTVADGMAFYTYDKGIDGEFRCMVHCRRLHPSVVAANTIEPKNEELTFNSRAGGNK